MAIDKKPVDSKKPSETTTDAKKVENKDKPEENAKNVKPTVVDDEDLVSLYKTPQRINTQTLCI